MNRKRRHADETEARHKRLRSEAFRSLVNAKGGQTCVPFSISSGAADYEIEEGEIVDDRNYISFTPNCTPPSSPRCIFSMNEQIKCRCFSNCRCLRALPLFTRAAVVTLNLHQSPSHRLTLCIVIKRPKCSELTRKVDGELPQPS